MTSFDQEELTLNQFLTLLEEEHRALLNGDADRVAELADQKLTCAEALEGSSALKAHLGDSSLVSPLRGRLQKVRDLNAINGSLIGDRLSLLRGQMSRLQMVAPQERRTGTYGRDGQENLPESRSLGSA